MNISVDEAGEKFKELIKSVENGESVTITRDGKPVADLMPAKRKGPRRFGTLKGQIKIIDPNWDRPQNDVEAWLRGDV